MKKISASVKKKDHDDKMEGRSLYVGDYKKAADGRRILEGMLLRSEKARAKIIGVEVPPLPPGYFYVDAGDVPGKNAVRFVEDDTPVFCRDAAEYVGDPIGMVVGPSIVEVERLVSGTRITYEELEPVLDMRKASEFFADFDFGYGDMEKAFAEADRVFEEEFSTGYQEHLYLEPQGMIAEPEPGGGMFVHGSAQCAYYVKNAVTDALALGPDKVHFRQDVTGGGFGGKETFPSILASQVAVAAHKANAPVRCVLCRREDMECSNKRHPSICRVRMAVKDGRVTAAKWDILLNGGAYSTLSETVLRRAVVGAPSVYSFPNIRIRGRAARTNTVPCDAFRGFGDPQIAFATERMMDHVAQSLDVDEIAFKKAHLLRQGDKTSTLGTYHFPVPLSAMIEKVDAKCDLRRKREAYQKPQKGRYRRGIGMSLSSHGCGLTGAGVERDLVKAAAKLRKHGDGTVEILASNGDIGQGVRTTFPKIVAYELGIPLGRVHYGHPDTARVPDSGPTNASRSLFVMGEILRRAAAKLREIWRDGEEQEAEEHYLEPGFTEIFDPKAFRGDPYPDYNWMVTAIEVEVDTWTGRTKVLDATGCLDAGTPIDEGILMGQMEGGLVQGIGYASTEQMDLDESGRIRQNTFSEYLAPTAKDVPRISGILHVNPYPEGPYGAKGAGEIPLVGAAPAYVAAVEQALGKRHRLCHIPFTAEDTMQELQKERRNRDGSH